MDPAVTPLTELANNLELATLESHKKALKFSPDPKNPERKVLSEIQPSASNSEKENAATPVTSKPTNRRRSRGNSLLQSGLRVSTPPGRCGLGMRRFGSSLDENSPAFKSPSTYTVVVRQRNLLLEDLDATSQDSTFSDPTFRFLEPSGFAPKKTDSPRRCLKFSCESLSTDSGISEDGWSELPVSGSGDDESLPIPESLDVLLSASLTTPNRRKRRGSSPKRRSSPPGSAPKRQRGPLTDRASEENRGTPAGKKAKSAQQANNKPKEDNKGTLFQYGFTKNKPPIVKNPSSEDIILALNRSTKEDLIGDLSRPHALPLLPGKHIDLKSISSDTLAKLINGEYDNDIGSFQIIDCRYPYEFEGGHIKGAENMYTCEDITQKLLKTEPRVEQDGKRHILIFHCEYSHERGPFLSRFLRKEDRNSHTYPTLAYPELYLLHGGYREFFQTHKELCEPQSYRQMQDPAHTSDFRHFKAKSKSWAPSGHRKMAVRSLSRLGVY